MRAKFYRFSVYFLPTFVVVALLVHLLPRGFSLLKDFILLPAYFAGMLIFPLAFISILFGSGKIRTLAASPDVPTAPAEDQHAKTIGVLKLIGGIAGFLTFAPAGIVFLIGLVEPLAGLYFLYLFPLFFITVPVGLVCIFALLILDRHN